MGLLTDIVDDSISTNKKIADFNSASRHNEALAGRAAEAAIAAVDFLSKLMALGIGVSYVSEPRVGGKISNGELLRIHAFEGVNRTDIGNVKRAIYPDQDQINSLTEIFAAEVAKHLKKIGEEYTVKNRPSKVRIELDEGFSGPVQQVASFGPVQQIKKTFTEEKQVRQAGASALRKVAQIFGSHMKYNLESNRNTNGTPMRKVKENYAWTRMLKHGVDPDAVFQATGQLENAFENGKYVLYYDPKKIENIKKGFGLNL